MEGFLPSARKNHVYTQSAGGRHHVEVEKEKKWKKPKKTDNQQTDMYFYSTGHYKT